MSVRLAITATFVALAPLLGCVDVEVADSNGTPLDGFSVTLEARGDVPWSSFHGQSRRSNVLLPLGLERTGVVIAQKEGYHPGIGIAAAFDSEDVEAGEVVRGVPISLIEENECLVAGPAGGAPPNPYVPGDVIVGLHDFLVGEEQSLLFEQYCLSVGDPVHHQFNVWIDEISGDAEAFFADLNAQGLGFWERIRDYYPRQGTSWQLANVRGLPGAAIPEDQLENIVYETLEAHDGIELLEVYRFSKHRVVSVPVGHEWGWVQLFEQHPAVRYADLNYIMTPY
jgi:hypothetical protein